MQQIAYHWAKLYQPFEQERWHQKLINIDDGIRLKKEAIFDSAISNPSQSYFHLIDINKYMKPQASEALTMHSIFQSKRLSQSQHSSPLKPQTDQLIINNRPIPLHIIRGKKIQEIRKQVNQKPQFWGCIIPQKFKHQRRAQSLQPVTKQKEIQHNFDRSHLLYSKFLKAKPVRILIRSSTSHSKRKTQEVLSTRPGTTISRNQLKFNNSSRENLRQNLENDWRNCMQSQVMKKYDSVEKKASDTSRIRSRIKIRGGILDFLQRGMRAISNGDEIDLNSWNYIK